MVANGFWTMDPYPRTQRGCLDDHNLPSLFFQMCNLPVHTTYPLSPYLLSLVDHSNLHLPTLLFHMPNLLEHITPLLSLLLVVLPSSSSASHIPILLDLLFYPLSCLDCPTSMPTHPVSSFRCPTSLFIHLLFSAFFSLSYRILLASQLPPTYHILSTFLPTL